MKIKYHIQRDASSVQKMPFFPVSGPRTLPRVATNKYDKFQNTPISRSTSRICIGYSPTNIKPQQIRIETDEMYSEFKDSAFFHANI